MNSDDMLDEYRVQKIFLIIFIFYFIVRIFGFETCYFIKRTYLVILFSFNTDKIVHIVASLCVVKKIVFWSQVLTLGHLYNSQKLFSFLQQGILTTLSK